MAVARALSMVWECRRVARPLSSGVKVGRASSQPLGRSPLMMDSYSPASCATRQAVTDVQSKCPGHKRRHPLQQLLPVAMRREWTLTSLRCSFQMYLVVLNIEQPGQSWLTTTAQSQHSRAHARQSQCRGRDVDTHEALICPGSACSCFDTA